MNVEYHSLETAIREGNIDRGVSEAMGLVEKGHRPFQIFSECIEPLLKDIGDQFSRLEIFLPEMVNSAQVVKAIQQAVKPYMGQGEELTNKGKVVIATVSGDQHDIGKNIVKALLEVNGYEVKDLGVDVDTVDIVQGAKDFGADIIALSALMLPSLPSVRDVIEYTKAVEGESAYKIMVGGGPVSQEWADEAGADGYGDDAMEAVHVADRLLK